MTKIDLQYDLVNYTPASASPVEANFDRVEQHVNQEVIERDGTVAMRAQLKLVGDPVEALDATPKQYVDQVLPIGIIMMFGGSSVPPGGRWAVCNGAELQSATYPALFAVIGNNFGGTAGRFNLPNMVDRMPMGNGGLATIGATGGNRDSTMPTHRHAMEQHTHGMSGHVHHFNHFHGLGAGAMSIENAAHDHGVRLPQYVRVNTGSGYRMQVTSGHFPEEIPVDWPDYYDVVSGGERANHAHSLTGTTVFVNDASSGGAGAPGNGDGNTWGPNVANTEQATSHYTQYDGTSPTNTNLPPYVGVAYIMRVM